MSGGFNSGSEYDSYSDSDSGVGESPWSGHFRAVWTEWAHGRAFENEQVVDDLKLHLVKQRKKLTELKRRAAAGTEGEQFWGFVDNCEERIERLERELWKRENKVIQWRAIANGDVGASMRSSVKEFRRWVEDDEGNKVRQRLTKRAPTVVAD
ncbi:hypothetical protein JX265_004801 [Neoarthrinium moseri]|uniref:Uncharacterized protein n=1 Tax=Neoarthrinium moseri TaxID=1658444 RepID=A0A9P9WQE7_9PEZI|nr:uncharacterized protein JN550_003696 [Neoarthrinium moseri]KAI1846831.1 hypothetical protein JX266_007052 [Neoarthrinium moseri]KAI1872822.1 hypothetical protein JN550_003696 [Neoarthrinium moseri]KAI1874593.1 hypothetical protein JX265_004801 [Neoarthrinium moseri]